MTEQETLAEHLLLAMDGDFLPGAGMSLANTDEDVALDKARPKEVMHWAARESLSWLASVLADEKTLSLVEVAIEEADGDLAWATIWALDAVRQAVGLPKHPAPVPGGVAARKQEAGE